MHIERPKNKHFPIHYETYHHLKESGLRHTFRMIRRRKKLQIAKSSYYKP